MKGKSLFSGKNINLLSAEYAQRLIKVSICKQTTTVLISRGFFFHLVPFFEGINLQDVIMFVVLHVLCSGLIWLWFSCILASDCHLVL